MSEPYRQDDDDLAYGKDYNQSRGYGGQKGTDRSFLGDTLGKLKSRYDQSSNRPQQDFGYGGPNLGQQQYGQQGQAGNYGDQNKPPYSSGQTQSQYQSQQQPNYGGNQSQYQPAYTGGPPPPHALPGYGQSSKPDLTSSLLGGLHSTIHGIGTGVAGLMGTQYTVPGQYGVSGQPGSTQNRFNSFVPPREDNQVKWYVDGCSYMWAVSQALESARESIWILDWWLTPELYLRRPPASNEEWRLDRVLQRAAQRGVKINIIVYKEVTQALTLSSSHTKHALEALSPNIGVFRHPDHLPDAQTAQSSLLSSFQGLKLDAAGATKLGSDALKGLYGLRDGVILYWAHHEKLCLIDGRMAFMGGLDLCFGRWDTNQHSIADAHPSDLNNIMFPGQDFNNARVSDFDDVARPFQNKLDRTKSSRMGWSDVSICLRGPCVDDLKHHFTDRWNFIYNEKYNVRKDVRYSRLPPIPGHFSSEGPRPTQDPGNPQNLQPGQYPPPPGSQPYTPPPWQASARPHTPVGATNISQSHTPQPSITQYGTGQYTGPIPPPPPGLPPQSSYQAPPFQTQSSYEAQTQQTSQYGQLPVHDPAQFTSSGYDPHAQQYNASSINQQSQLYTAAPISQPVLQSHDSYSGYQHPAAQTSQQYTGVTSTQPPVPHTEYSSYQSSVSPAPQHYQTSSPGPQQYQSHDHYTTSQTNQSGQYPSTYAANELPSQQSPPNVYQQAQTGSRGIGDESRYPEQEYGGERGYGGSNKDRYKQEGKRLGNELGAIGNMIQSKVEQKVPGNLLGSSSNRPSSRGGTNMRCQLLRSCTKWSNGTPTEHSVQNAYIDVIQNSQHFIYIENQFFITATGDKQGPVKNQIGKAIVERILKAARERQPWRAIVVMPAIPAFAGDFSNDASLGTRAICEFQYNSICRGGHSIMEEVSKAGYNPMDYIRFYNLRNYDRINFTVSMMQAQQQSGVYYEDARKQQEDALGSGYGGHGQVNQSQYGQTNQGQYGQTNQGQYGPTGTSAQQYQTATQNAPNVAADRWDSVASCYMLGGEDIRNVPWSGPPEAELDAFVSEELYVHSKVLIADDQVVICGSANLNDRSMLGYHDSEIALLISDLTPQQSTMAGRPWQASRFAASLRRQLFRKHLGLIRPQDAQNPDLNFDSVQTPNSYDWGSPEDHIVSDPLSDTFLSLWNTRARTNTEVYRKAFRAVPDDYIRTWTEYKEYFEYYFNKASNEAVGKDKLAQASRVEYGHVVRADFPGGVKELKDLLSRVKGTLVEMPLCFLLNEDIAKEGLGLNALTEEIYT